MLKEKGGAQVVVNDTICRKVANRIPQLREFAQKHDVVIFVSGEKSSNGKKLFATCCEVTVSYTHLDVYKRQFVY